MIGATAETNPEIGATLKPRRGRGLTVIAEAVRFLRASPQNISKYSRCSQSDTSA